MSPTEVLASDALERPMKRSSRAPVVPVTLPSMSTTTMCSSSRNPPTSEANLEVSGRGATLTHFTPGRYSRSSYSVRTESTVTLVEFVSATTSEAVKLILSLLRPIYKRRSIVALIAAVFVP